MKTVERGIEFNVLNANTFKDERNLMLKVTGQAGKQFNQFVRDSIYFFYHEGNHNVTIVNEVLRVAYLSKGINYSRLLAFLAEVIPHKATDAKRGKDKSGGSVNIPPRFAEKKKDADYDWNKALDFLRSNLSWAEYGREVSHRAFSVDKSAHAVVLQLIRNGVTVDEFVNKLKADYAIESDKKTRKVSVK